MNRRNGVVVGVLAGLVFGMTALSFAAVPLYTMFCKATGFGGTTQRVAEAAKKIGDRKIEIRFNTDVNAELPWSFKPNQRSVTLKIGETGMATFHAHNDSSEAIVGTAVYNVTPEKAGLYFDKIQCFCFTQQVLKAGEDADLPVAFFVDPAIADDRNLDDVQVITLSYTFYKAKSQALDKAIDAEGRAAETREIDKAVSAQSGATAAKTPAAASSGSAALAAAPRVE
ncbi:MAG TPA: cytochrome c oxidase assembly protein [Alphaproteobacteria bacterium]|jgi:cytochrome c oxidase assembly protein subunit 11|nr:cytochrome c oxidase assembly protein [Alphaproteobacteria bacterium]